MLPSSEFDQWDNPVVTRDGRLHDPVTGHPFELWLQQPQMEFVLVPSGEFMMGSPYSESRRHHDEGPMHKVRITSPFYVGKYEVTQVQWRHVMEAAPWSGKPFAAPHPRHAASYIDWHDCASFLAALRDQTGITQFAFPTEAQWEYACRAESTTAYSFGENRAELGEYAWFDMNTEVIAGMKYAQAVGQKRASPWGMYDMHGNVWEWCADWYSENYYRHGPRDDPRGPRSGHYRVVRGGSWVSSYHYLRSARRYGVEPVGRFNYRGLRLAVSLARPDGLKGIVRPRGTSAGTLVAGRGRPRCRATTAP